MVIAIDIGGTKIRVGVSNRIGSFSRTIRFNTPDIYEQSLELITRAIGTLTQNSPPDAIGISSPGPLNTKEGLILNPRNVRWQNVNIVRDLENKLHCPVVLGHDATLGGIAEAKYGAGRHYKSILYITISTGIGTSFILDGKPINSVNNLEGGRMFIMPEAHDKILSTFEELVSGRAILDRYSKIAAKIYDPKIWHDIAGWMAVGIYNCILMTQPEVVILAGGVAVHFDRFIKPLQTHIQEFHTPYALPKIVQAQFVESAPLVGASIIAAEKINSE